MKKTKRTLFIFILFLCIIVGIGVGRTITVGPSGGGYEFTSIQTAINDAVGGDEIVVAPGTYFEAIDFAGKAVRLYSSGGPEVTVIDGKGTLHVVQCVSGEGADTILEGFTITGGYAGGTWRDGYGGGMFNDGSSPTVIGCIFTGNHAQNGGGMYNYYYSHPIVTGCSFIGNTADSGGGGMSSDGNSNPTVSSCSFIENTSYFGGGMGTGGGGIVVDCVFSGNTGEYGGGMMNSGTVIVTGCVFSENTAKEGGGMNNWGFSDVTVTDCSFNDNTVNGNGGGMHNTWNSSIVARCHFSGNTAYFVVDEDDDWGTYGPGDGGYGGGMFNQNFEGPDVIDCTFSGNFASYGGGISNWQECDSTITQCLFIGNAAAKGGGGIYNGQSSSPIVTGSTFSGNTAVVFGGGIRNWRSSMSGTNCILWGNTPNQISSEEQTPSMSYSNIQGGWSGVGTNNIDAEPLFVDMAGGDLRLGRGSPCIDAGNNAAVPAGITKDFIGWPRFVDDPCVADTGSGTLPIVDMGVYEFMPADIDGSDKIGLSDCIKLASCWLSSGSGDCLGTDINCDGIVSLDDFAFLATWWLVDM